MSALKPSRQTAWRLGELAELPDHVRRGHVAVGNFDGVHIGHRALVRRVSERARMYGGKAVVVTFERYPWSDHAPNTIPARLTSTKEKSRLLVEAGADEVVNLEFDRELAALPPEAFIADILVRRFEARSVVMSKNFYYAPDRSISPAQFVEMSANEGPTVDVMPPQTLSENGQVVSSTAIRACLAHGNIAEANRLLGRRWMLDGVVVHGDKRGRELGFPTANITLGNDIRICFGIYAVRVLIGGRIANGVASYGRRPQFDNGLPRLEIHLFDFQDDIYGQNLSVEFVGYQRPELTFADVAALLRQMDADRTEARRILKCALEEPGMESVFEHRSLLNADAD